MKLLYHSIAKGSQHTLAEWTYGFGDMRLRIHIRSDNADFQGYARAEMWDAAGMKWNPVTSVHYGEMGTEPNLYLQRDWGEVEHYARDHDELMRRIELIVPGWLGPAVPPGWVGPDDTVVLAGWVVTINAEGEYLYIRHQDHAGAVAITAAAEGFEAGMWDSDAANEVACCSATYDELNSDLRAGGE